jgi:hypothetical protein
MGASLFRLTKARYLFRDQMVLKSAGAENSCAASSYYTPSCLLIKLGGFPFFSAPNVKTTCFLEAMAGRFLQSYLGTCRQFIYCFQLPIKKYSV